MVTYVHSLADWFASETLVFLADANSDISREESQDPQCFIRFYPKTLREYDSLCAFRRLAPGEIIFNHERNKNVAILVTTWKEDGFVDPNIWVLCMHSLKRRLKKLYAEEKRFDNPEELIVVPTVSTYLPYKKDIVDTRHIYSNFIQKHFANENMIVKVHVR